MKRSRAAFTVLEVLVTLAIVTLFSSAVYAVFLGAVVDTRRIEHSAMAARLGQSILALLERDLVAALPASEEFPHFDGTVDTDGMGRLEFSAATDSRAASTTGQGGASDLIRVAYLVQPDADAEAEAGSEALFKLYRREEPAAGRAVATEGRAVLLASGVKRFALEYFDGAGWSDVWTQPSVPRAVRIALVLERKLQVSSSAPAMPAEFPFGALVAIPVGVPVGVPVGSAAGG